MKITRFEDIPQFTSHASYGVDVSWGYLEEHLKSWSDRKRKLDLDPDFQRGHVWTRDQQVRYVEFVLRGGHSSRELLFNCVGWMGSFEGPFVLVDGKQRLTAVRAFLNNEFQVFGSFYNEFTGVMRLCGPSFRFSVNNLKTRKQVLVWYLELNAGGTPHTQEELERVVELLRKEAKK